MGPSVGFVRSFVVPFLFVSSNGRTGERGLGYHSVLCYMCGGQRIKETKTDKTSNSICAFLCVTFLKQ